MKPITTVGLASAVVAVVAELIALAVRHWDLDIAEDAQLAASVAIVAGLTWLAQRFFPRAE